VNANFFWVTIQKPPYGQGENHVQLAYGVDSIGPDAVVAPRLFGASALNTAIVKAVELAKSLDLPVCISGLPDVGVAEVEKMLKEKDVKILNESEV
jgi:hypothetical protein